VKPKKIKINDFLEIFTCILDVFILERGGGRGRWLFLREVGYLLIREVGY